MDRLHFPAGHGREQLAHNFGVSSFPTFIFILKGKEVSRTQGANIQAISNELFKHMATANAEQEKFNSSGKVLGSSSGDVIEVKVVKIDGTSSNMKFPRSNTSTTKHLRDRMCLALRIDMNKYRIIFKGIALNDGDILDSFGFFDTNPTSIHIVEDESNKTESKQNSVIPSSSFKWSGSQPTNFDSITSIYQTGIPIYDQHRKKCIDLIITYMNNIVENPSETKYQKIKLSNAHFTKNIKDVAGGMKIMEEIGFEVDKANEFFVLKTTSLPYARFYLNHLKDLTTKEIDGSRLEAIGFSGEADSAASSLTSSSSIDINDNKIRNLLSNVAIASQFIDSNPGLADARNKILEKGNDATKKDLNSIISTQINTDLVQSALNELSKKGI